MKILKTLNNQGSTLQIVLVTFLTMSFALTSCLYLIGGQMKNHHYIDLIMQQKNLEIFLIEYYVNQMENDILLSEYYENNHYQIQSYVDDLGNCYEIMTRIKSRRMNYQFIVQIDVNDYYVLKFEYKEV